jgi:hypothetical protein
MVKNVFSINEIKSIFERMIEEFEIKDDECVRKNEKF